MLKWNSYKIELKRRKVILMLSVIGYKQPNDPNLQVPHARVWFVISVRCSFIKYV